jgi:hypothetical protein
LADRDIPIEIEKLNLPAQYPEGPLLDALSECEKTHVQFGTDWLVNLASHAMSPHESAVIYVARSGTGDLLALPLKLDSRTGQAHALGSFYTSAWSPIVRSKSPERLLVALLGYLAKEEKLTGLTLSPLDSGLSMFPQLQSALSRSGWKGIHRFPCSGNWIHDLDGGSWDAYLKSRPSRLHNTITRKTRHFLEDGRGRLELVEGGESLEQSIATFVAVYNQSWKQEEPFPRFVPELLRLAARRGWLRLGIAHYDDTPVAAQVWLVWEHTAYIFKLAHGEAYKQLSPGTVLTAYMMEQVIDKDRVNRIDFLSGDDEYKRDWMSVRGERSGIAAYNPATVRGCVMLIVRGARSLLPGKRGSSNP